MTKFLLPKDWNKGWIDPDEDEAQTGEPSDLRP